MKMFSLFFVLIMSFASVASYEEVETFEAVEIVEMPEQTETDKWRGCIAIDSNYNPYWGRTANAALNNCNSHSEIGDCRISRCK